VFSEKARLLNLVGVTGRRPIRFEGMDEEGLLVYWWEVMFSLSHEQINADARNRDSYN
jgi:hypothetical protein